MKIKNMKKNMNKNMNKNMRKKKTLIVLASVLVALGIILLAGYMVLRNSPAWNAITMFSDGYRAERFRTMDLVFPATNGISQSEDVWTFEKNPKELPDTYTFEGESHDTMAFLERTETTGLVVLFDQEIVFEDYYQEYDEHAKATSWSVAKSFLSAMVGIAIDEGLIDSVHDPITDYVPVLQGTAYQGIPIHDILTMSSGVGFDEDYERITADINMIIIRSFAFSEPMSDYMKGLETVREPGIYNDYVSSDSFVLGLLIREVSGKSVSAYLEEKIWKPMGAEEDSFWIVDSENQEVAFFGLNAVLRDYLRFGNLYLHNGYRDGTSVIPSEWIEASIAIHGPHLAPGENPNSFWTFGYGYQWWMPEEPEGDFSAIGIWGQYIYIHPEYNMVVVKTSSDYYYDDNDHETVAFFRSLGKHYASMRQ